jgi:hypothetical protein
LWKLLWKCCKRACLWGILLTGFLISVIDIYDWNLELLWKLWLKI